MSTSTLPARVALIALSGLTPAGFLVADDLGSRTVTRWSPCLEWKLENPSCRGNPFDLVARVVFEHESGDASRTTEMFYDGGQTWRFRFTGTRQGNWTFATSSRDPQLDGHHGKVLVRPNPDPEAMGFLCHVGNKFAVQIGRQGQLRPFLFFVYQNPPLVGRQLGRRTVRDFYDAYRMDEEGIDRYLDDARRHGFRVVFGGGPNTRWFDHTAGVDRLSKLGAENPDPETFRQLERFIRRVHGRGMVAHFWMWRDASRDATPRSLDGGINGAIDRRLQRYVAARLGPLPGWTMGCGFDLQEWISEEQVRRWASFLHEKMGWRPMLSARGRNPAATDIASYSRLVHTYQDACRNLDADQSRPHLFEERDYYKRQSEHTMDWTRRHLWRYTMAGGHGCWFGVDGHEYPNPEQLRTFDTFWLGKRRFRFDLRRADPAGDCLALASPDGKRHVVWSEEAAKIHLDLSTASGPLSAVAVDAKRRYREIDLGTLPPDKRTWRAPYRSDWALAVGRFD